MQLYINDVISSVTTPVKELKRFKKVWLEPGEVKKIEFTLTPDDLSFLDANLQPTVEPGAFEVMAGASAADIRLQSSFEVIR